MSEKVKAWIVIICTMIAALSFFGALGAREVAQRKNECSVLQSIGVHRGETVIIAGDMPTWKIKCLMGEGDE